MTEAPLSTALPWQDTADQLCALAAGLQQSDEALYWQARAQLITHPHAGGQTTVHHWQAPLSNGLPPLVLLHGGSGSWTHWVRSIGPLLQAGHDVWAIDLPGFGASDTPPKATDADGLLPVLADVLHTLFPLRSVRLLGFSFGGMTAGMLAAAYPHLVEQLIIVGAPGLGLRSTQPVRLQGWRHLDDPAEQLQRHIYNLSALMLHNPAHIDRATVALHVHNVRRDRLPRRRISSTDILLQSLRQVQCPVSALYGAHDALYPDTLDQVEALMATSTPIWHGMQRIAQAGHWVQYEQADAFHAALLPQLAVTA